MSPFKLVLKIVAGAVVVVPGGSRLLDDPQCPLTSASFYLGLAASEWNLSKDFTPAPGTTEPLDTATRARIVQ